MKIVYHLGARLDVLEAVEHYENEDSPALADRFTTELEHFIDRIAQMPLSYREVHPGVRRVNLNKFPYHVLFRIVDSETVKVLTVKHNKRRPLHGMKRR
jgi:plasmid stabilization system protein ParE